MSGMERYLSVERRVMSPAAAAKPADGRGPPGWESAASVKEGPWTVAKNGRNFLAAKRSGGSGLVLDCGSLKPLWLAAALLREGRPAGLARGKRQQGWRSACPGLAAGNAG